MTTRIDYNNGNDDDGNDKSDEDRKASGLVSMLGLLRRSWCLFGRSVGIAGMVSPFVA